MVYLCQGITVLIIISGIKESAQSNRTFHIDFEHNTFLKDGKPFRYVSGSIHYSRVPFPYWEDRLRKMYAAGLDAIQIYVPWNVHQPEHDQFDFQGQNNLFRFITLADKIGLLVILRAGPYICGEWDYGGFPYWLKVKDQNMLLRSMDPGYIKEVTRWFSVLLPKIKPFLYKNGGPIIMVQIENEYGSYRDVKCDHEYMAYLRDLFLNFLGEGVQLFTTDGSGINYLQCGAIDGAYATVDFGHGDAAKGFAPMRQWSPKGPLVNSEYYTGWLDAWGWPPAHVLTSDVIETLKDMLDMGANVNMYMFEGGTNFGYMNGADPIYKPVITSYDYDAPLSEAGDTTLKYMAIRSLIAQYKEVPAEVPPNATKEDYGIVHMKELSSVIKALPFLSQRPCIKTQFPIKMEQAQQPYGYALYRTILTSDVKQATLNLTAVRDRGYVMLDGTLVGLVYRNTPPMSTSLTAYKGQQLDILIENMGRINYGRQINENQKGLIANVTLNDVILTSWQYFHIDLKHAFNLTQGLFPNFISGQLRGHVTNMSAPTLYHGSFTLRLGQIPADTYLNMCGWSKGQALVNGFNLGRYWPVKGPQVTLYVPGIHLKPYPHSNVIIILELEAAPSTCWNVTGSGHGSCSIKLQKDSILGGKCDANGKVIMLNKHYYKQSLANRYVNFNE